MSNFDINVDRQTDGRMDGRTYRTLLQAGAIIRKMMEKSALSVALSLVLKFEQVQFNYYPMLCLKVAE